MGLGEDLGAWAARVKAKAARVESLIQDAAYEELERQLRERLPNLTPVDTGALARGYTFRMEDGQLIVGSEEFYALAVSRFGGNYDLRETIEREAEQIVKSAAFVKAVEARVFAQL